MSKALGALRSTKIAIVGGGCAGSTIASQLIASKKIKPNEITIFDASPLHYYQPGFTMLSGGLFGDNDVDMAKHEKSVLAKPMKSLYNPQINFVTDKITEFEPDSNKIYNSNGDGYKYDYLIINTGIELKYKEIEGALDALNNPDNKVGSMYKLEYAKKLNQITQGFFRGKAVSTQCRMPIKCGGAPQKYVYLADNVWRNNKVRQNIDFHFFTALPVMFPVKKYNESLEKIIQSKNVNVHKNLDICKVDDSKNKVYFKNTQSGEIVEESYDMLNIVPQQGAYDIMKSAPLGLVDNNGFVDVNSSTLQSNKYENIFSLGDCSSLPTSKTAAAIYSQSPILVNNLFKQMDKQKLNAIYNGYTSCPVLCGDNKVLLCEFGYGNEPMESFSKYFDQSKPQTSFYYLKRYLFPFCYWNLAPRSLWYGSGGPLRPTFA